MLNSSTTDLHSSFPQRGDRPRPALMQRGRTTLCNFSGYPHAAGLKPCLGFVVEEGPVRNGSPAAGGLSSRGVDPFRKKMKGSLVGAGDWLRYNPDLIAWMISLEVATRVCSAMGRTARASILNGALIWSVLAFGTSPACAQPTFKKPPRYEPSAAERGEIETKLAELTRRSPRCRRLKDAQRDVLADVAIYQKAAAWTLRLNEFFAKKDVAATLKVIERGLERARQLADGQRPWAARFRLLHPRVLLQGRRLGAAMRPDRPAEPRKEEGRDRRRPPAAIGLTSSCTAEATRSTKSTSSRPTTARPPADTEAAASGIFRPPRLRPHEQRLPLGRRNRAIFEAIAAVSRSHSIDDRRIVLRGFSMGEAGPGTWDSITRASGRRSKRAQGFSETKNYAKLQGDPDDQVKATPDLRRRRLRGQRIQRSHGRLRRRR